MSKERFNCYYCSGIENIIVEDTINNKTYIEDNIVNLLNQQDQRIAELEVKLAEKEKEIITLNCVISEIHNDIKELHEFKVGEDEYDLTDSDARFSLQCDLLNNAQDKISFAIAKLEKVKEFNIQQVFSSKPLDNFIDNQIKQLKGEKE